MQTEDFWFRHENDNGNECDGCKMADRCHPERAGKMPCEAHQEVA